MDLIWQGHGLEDVIFCYPQALAWAQARDNPVHTLSLRYLGPVQIKERGEWVTTPRFSPLMKAVVRRLRILSVVHGGGEWAQPEYGPLLDLAETVALEHDETWNASYQRNTKRSGAYEAEGFIGQAWYASQEDLRPLLPILWLGQWLHVGKGYVFGNGRYVIEHVYR